MGRCVGGGAPHYGAPHYGAPHYGAPPLYCCVPCCTARLPHASSLAVSHTCSTALYCTHCTSPPWPHAPNVLTCCTTVLPYCCPACLPAPPPAGRVPCPALYRMQCVLPCTALPCTACPALLCPACLPPSQAKYALSCPVPQYALPCPVPHCSALLTSTALYYPIPYCTVLYRVRLSPRRLSTPCPAVA